MRQTLKFFTTLGVFAALVAVAPRGAAAEEFQGRLYGGVDLGVMQPLNALNRYVATGGAMSPFIGYKFFDDKDLQLNLGLEGQLQFIGGGASPCTGCLKGGGDDDMYALGYLAGPRLSLPIGPVEMYGKFLGGGMSGLTSGAITDTSGGFLAGGGVNYNISDNVGLGLFGNWNRQYQRVHGVGDVRFVTTGIELLAQTSPPAPPPPPVAAPPPPPPPAPMKKKIVLRGVNFDFDKSNIRPDAVPILEQACKTLKEEPSINVSCQGYTDSVGTDAYNMGLSDRRANAVRMWLIKCGISASRLTAKGFGESNPVATNETAEGRAQNRRTELVVTNQ
jgi:outer membrane protein OmpA-like peptidoglycan-associated protein